MHGETMLVCFAVDEINFLAAYPARKGLGSHPTLSRNELGHAGMGRGRFTHFLPCKRSGCETPQARPILAASSCGRLLIGGDRAPSCGVWARSRTSSLPSFRASPAVKAGLLTAIRIWFYWCPEINLESVPLRERSDSSKWRSVSALLQRRFVTSITKTPFTDG